MLKVGDHVRIKPAEEWKVSIGFLQDCGWSVYLGRDTVVTDIYTGIGKYYHLAIDGSYSWWAEECLIDLKRHMFKMFLERMI